MHNLLEVNSVSCLNFIARGYATERIHISITISTLTVQWVINSLYFTCKCIPGLTSISVVVIRAITQVVSTSSHSTSDTVQSIIVGLGNLVAATRIYTNLRGD